MGTDEPMSEDRQTYALDEKDSGPIARLLIGRRIVQAERGSFDYPGRASRYSDLASGRLTLDDGTQVYVLPNQGGCSCGAGDYELSALATVDNAITSVRMESPEADSYGDYSGHYRIYVFAEAIETLAVDIEGDDGNGYYGTGYALHVLPAAVEPPA